MAPAVADRPGHMILMLDRAHAAVIPSPDNAAALPECRISLHTDEYCEDREPIVSEEIVFIMNTPYKCLRTIARTLIRVVRDEKISAI